MGRPTILNQQVINKVVENTLKGISIESICALSGISPRSYYDWIKQGKQDIEDGVESVHALFAESVQAAIAEVEERMLAQAIGTDEIGARWYLSRKMRKDYGDKQEIEISGDMEVEIVWPQEDEDNHFRNFRRV